MSRDHLHYLIGTLADAAYSAAKLSPEQLADVRRVVLDQLATANPAGWAALQRVMTGEEPK